MGSVVGRLRERRDVEARGAGLGCALREPLDRLCDRGQGGQAVLGGAPDLGEAHLRRGGLPRRLLHSGASERHRVGDRADPPAGRGGERRDTVERLPRPLREPPHLVGDDGEPAAVLARASGLDRRVQREQIRLIRDLLVDPHDAVDLRQLRGELLELRADAAEQLREVDDRLLVRGHRAVGVARELDGERHLVARPVDLDRGRPRRVRHLLADRARLLGRRGQLDCSPRSASARGSSWWRASRSSESFNPVIFATRASNIARSTIDWSSWASFRYAIRTAASLPGSRR